MTPPASPPGAPIAVSLLEDNARERASLRGLLEANPRFRFARAYAAADAALVDVPLNPPDVLLVDIRLGGSINGIECVRGLKEQCPGLPMLMVTAIEDTDLLFRTLQAGAVGHVLKRDPPERLFQAIEDAVHGGGAVSSVMARKLAQYFERQAPGQASTPASTRVHKLSPKETQILRSLTQGKRDKEILAVLQIERSTLRTHLKRIFEKLHVSSRTEAAVFYTKSNRT